MAWEGSMRQRAVQLVNRANAAGGRDNIHRTDIYALGVILFQVVTGQFPFTASTYEGWMAAHLTERTIDPRSLRPDLPQEVAAAILKALEKEKGGTVW
jgi:hypothetical protein